MTDYYFAVNGDDSNPGTEAAPWQTWTKFLAQFRFFQGGDNVFFRRGDIFVSESQSVVFNDSGISDTNRLSIDAYGSGDNPIIKAGTSVVNYLFYINSRNTNEDGNAGGMNISNIRFEGNDEHTTVNGIRTINGVSYATLNNVEFDGFHTALSISTDNLDNMYDWEIRNSSFTNNSTIGFLGGSTNLVIDNVLFDNNGFLEPNLGHNVYLAGDHSNMLVNNIESRNNTLKYQNVIDLGTDDFTVNPVVGNTATGDVSGATGEITAITADSMTIHVLTHYATQFQAGETVTVNGNTSTSTITTKTDFNQSASVSLVGHGNFDGLVIENSEFYEEPGTATPQGFGIGIGPGYTNQEESFRNVIIRNNNIQGMGTTSITLSSAQDVLVTDNYIRQSVRFATGILFNQDNDDTFETDRITITNNEIIIENDPLSLTKTGIELQVPNGTISGNTINLTNENAANEFLRTSPTITVENNTLNSFTSPYVEPVDTTTETFTRPILTPVLSSVVNS